MEHLATHYCSRCLTSFAQDLERCPNLGCRRDRPSDGWGQLLQDGEVFDRNYRIARKLAMGGAGVTYLAQEIDDRGQVKGQDLAIKVLLAHRDHGPYLKRLATEAGILRELDHPNIVQCLGFVHRAGHTPYLVTRFEAGGSLLDHIRRSGRLRVKVAAQIGRQICWALSVAHSREIIHRDLKPENVLLAEAVPGDKEPVVRVADFGIAKVEGSLGSGLTRMGAFVGTPQYAAPEQFASDKPTHATDVYAVGALLYFCIMARPVVLFADRLSLEDSLDLLLQALPPRVERSDDEADDVRRINRLLEAVMAIDAASRPTIGELDDQLGALLAGRDPTIVARGPVGAPEAGNEIAAPLVATQTSRLEGDPLPGDLAQVQPDLRLAASNPASLGARSRPGSVPGHSSPGQASSAQGHPSPQPSLTLDPNPSRDREPPTVARRVGSALALVLGFVGVGAGAFLLGMVAMYFGAPEVFEQWRTLGPSEPVTVDPPIVVEPPPPPPKADPFQEPGRVDVTTLETDDAKKLKKSLYDQVAVRWPPVSETCGLAPGTYILALALAKTGAIEAVHVDRRDDPMTAPRHCAEQAFGQLSLSVGKQEHPLAVRFAMATSPSAP